MWGGCVSCPREAPSTGNMSVESELREARITESSINAQGKAWFQGYRGKPEHYHFFWLPLFTSEFLHFPSFLPGLVLVVAGAKGNAGKMGRRWGCYQFLYQQKQQLESRRGRR